MASSIPSVTTRCNHAPSLGIPWWRHQMETFSASLAICAEISLVTGEFPTQRPLTRSFDVFFDLRLNKQLSKQRLCCWFETPSYPLWHHCNAISSMQASNQKPTTLRAKRWLFTHDVIKWKSIPRYWPFVRGIHRWPVVSPHIDQWCGALIFFLWSAPGQTVIRNITLIMTSL